MRASVGTACSGVSQWSRKDSDARSWRTTGFTRRIIAVLLPVRIGIDRSNGQSARESGDFDPVYGASLAGSRFVVAVGWASRFAPNLRNVTDAGDAAERSRVLARWCGSWCCMRFFRIEDRHHRSAEVFGGRKASESANGQLCTDLIVTMIRVRRLQPNSDHAQWA